MFICRVCLVKKFKGLRFRQRAICGVMIGIYLMLNCIYSVFIFIIAVQADLNISNFAIRTVINNEVTSKQGLGQND